MRTTGGPILGMLAATVLVALLVAFRALETGIAAVVWANLLLVCVTSWYVLLTAGILSESRQTGLTVKELAAETATLAAAAVQQADVAHRTLSHLQRPVLVLRVLGDVGPDEEQIPLQVQNVGEAAAIWPKVNFPDHGPRDNLLGEHPPHILPPQQFSEAVPEPQRLRVSRPRDGRTGVWLECEDPRTGRKIKREWILYMEDGAKWYADPVPQDEV